MLGLGLKIDDKQDYFNFEIENAPFFDRDVPQSISFRSVFVL